MCAFVCLSGLSMQSKHQCAGKKCSLCGSMTTKHFSAVQAHPIESLMNMKYMTKEYQLVEYYSFLLMKILL
jgi:hypothetical protein